MNASVPLEEALPWSVESHRVILINDSNETDGRFLLHALAKQNLGNPTNGNVLWLACGPVTDVQVATALKKNGCDIATLYLRSSLQTPKTSSLPLTIRSLTVDMASTCLQMSDEVTWNPDQFLRGWYKQVKSWVNEQSRKPCWVLLDDVSSLASVLGDPRLVHRFVHSLTALSNNNQGQSFGITIRCSNDVDQSLYKAKQLEDQNLKSAPLWVGFGGQCNNPQYKSIESAIPWERHLVDLADGIVDVVPLSSGYSREAHGRLIFTLHPSGRGWRNVAGDEGLKSSDSLTGFKINSTVNYCITDNGVRAIRLRGSTSKQ